MMTIDDDGRGAVLWLTRYATWRRYYIIIPCIICIVSRCFMSRWRATRMTISVPCVSLEIEEEKIIRHDRLG